MGPQATGSTTIGTVIRCVLQINNPHRSTHVPGTVNVVATVKCTAPVTEIRILTVLHRNGTLVDQRTTTRRGSSTHSGNAAAACANGSYYGAALATVIFPAGYSPPSGTGLVGSSTVSIAC